MRQQQTNAALYNERPVILLECEWMINAANVNQRGRLVKGKWEFLVLFLQVFPLIEIISK